MSPEEIQCRISESPTDTRNPGYVLDSLAIAIVHVVKNEGE
jgi:hypothetical protein